MLTDFRKRKLIALFDMYDVDKNGLLEQADYERIGTGMGISRAMRSRAM